MREPTFYVLTALLRGPLHGYAIMKRAEELSGGRVRLATGTLYTALDRLTAEGHVQLVSQDRGVAGVRALPHLDGGGQHGHAAVGVDLEPGRSALGLAGCCGGDLRRITRVVKLSGFVQAGPDFFDIPKVINGCSDLMVQAFGEAGRHARSAVGVYRLPLNFAVEVDAVVELA